MTRTQLAEKGPPGFNRLLLIRHLFARSHKEAIAGADRGLQAQGLPSWPMINDPGWAGPGPGPEERGVREPRGKEVTQRGRVDRGGERRDKKGDTEEWRVEMFDKSGRLLIHGESRNYDVQGQ